MNEGDKKTCGTCRWWQAGVPISIRSIARGDKAGTCSAGLVDQRIWTYCDHAACLAYASAGVDPLVAKVDILLNELTYIDLPPDVEKAIAAVEETLKGRERE